VYNTRGTDAGLEHPRSSLLIRRKLILSIKKDIAYMNKKFSVDSLKEIQPFLKKNGLSTFWLTRLIPYLTYRELLVMVDLIGIEPNPGPTKAKKKMIKSSSSQPSKSKGMMKKGNPSSKQSVMRPQASVASAYATPLSSGKAQIFRSSVDSCRIVHRELIASVTSASTSVFTVNNSFSINPGLFSTFPWLSVEAQGWEKYRFNSLRFCSYTRTGSNTAGSILLVPDYDAADNAPSSEVIASSYFGTEEDAPWKDICCILDKNRLSRELYLRNAPLSAKLDIKTYDVGNFYVCTVDASSSASWSKIWVEYDITLINPQLPPGGGYLAGTYSTTNSTAAAIFTSAVATGNFGFSASSNVLTITGLGVGVEYSLTTFLVGTVITAYTSTATSITGKSGLSGLINSTATGGGIWQTFVANASICVFTFSITATTITSAYLTLTPLIPAPSF
jgi:hypothetical protein